jgi:hypothetical protein
VGLTPSIFRRPFDHASSTRRTRAKSTGAHVEWRTRAVELSWPSWRVRQQNAVAAGARLKVPDKRMSSGVGLSPGRTNCARCREIARARLSRSAALVLSWQRWKTGALCRPDEAVAPGATALGFCSRACATLKSADLG